MIGMGHGYPITFETTVDVTPPPPPLLVQEIRTQQQPHSNWTSSRFNLAILTTLKLISP